MRQVEDSVSNLYSRNPGKCRNAEIRPLLFECLSVPHEDLVVGLGDDPGLGDHGTSQQYVHRVVSQISCR